MPGRRDNGRRERLTNPGRSCVSRCGRAGHPRAADPSGRAESLLRARNTSTPRPTLSSAGIVLTAEDGTCTAAWYRRLTCQEPRSGSASSSLLSWRRSPYGSPWWHVRHGILSRSTLIVSCLIVQRGLPGGQVLVPGGVQLVVGGVADRPSMTARTVPGPAHSWRMPGSRSACAIWCRSSPPATCGPGHGAQGGSTVRWAPSCKSSARPPYGDKRRRQHPIQPDASSVHRERLVPVSYSPVSANRQAPVISSTPNSGFGSQRPG